MTGRGRLGLVLDMVVSRNGERYSTDEPFIGFMEAVRAAHFEELQFCSRVRDSDEDADYALPSPAFRVVPLPWYDNVTQVWLKAPAHWPRARRILAQHLPTWDLLIACHAAHPYTPMALRMARRQGLPSVLWLRGDQIRDLKYRLTGLRRQAGLIAARMAIRSLPAGTPVISMGRDDFDFLPHMGPVHVAYSSKFDEEDMVPLPRPVRPPGSPTRMLYVGRLAPEKGLEVLLEAMRRLRREAVGGLSLTIVGADFHGSDYGPRLMGAIEASDLGDAVRFAGHVSYGEALFRQYDAHDLVVLPSFTEGFPQVLLEAMVRGVPVVSTAVGGIPRVIQDDVNGLLIPPRDARALAGALRRLMVEPELGPRLARAGQESVRAYTRRAQVDGIYRFLDQCYPQAGFARGVRG